MASTILNNKKERKNAEEDKGILRSSISPASLPVYPSPHYFSASCWPPDPPSCPNWVPASLSTPWHTWQSHRSGSVCSIFHINVVTLGVKICFINVLISHFLPSDLLLCYHMTYTNLSHILEKYRNSLGFNAHVEVAMKYECRPICLRPIFFFFFSIGNSWRAKKREKKLSTLGKSGNICFECQLW